MSTKMSTDMNISRPTSRVIRAPGGGSTFSLGMDDQPQAVHASKRSIQSNSTLTFGGEDPVKTVHPSKKSIQGGKETFSFSDEFAKPPKPPVEKDVEVVEPVPVEVEEVKETEKTGKVCVLVGGDLVPDVVCNAVVKALTIEGITGVITSTAPDVSVLPYKAKKILGTVKDVDVLVVAAIIMDPSGTIASALTATLMQIALETKIPIIPSFTVQESLLESKALLPDKATKAAKSVLSILDLNSGMDVEIAEASVPVIEKNPELTPDLDEVEPLMKILYDSLKAHGARSFAGLSRKFKIMDDNNSGTIDLMEFTKAISEHALGWSKEQIKKIFDNFDADKSGAIDFNEFIVTLRGKLNERRYQMVLLAYEILDADKSGIIDIDDIRQKYDASKHPDVISGKKTKDDILNEFLDTFDTVEKDGKVTVEEFCKYYSNVSASIDEDDYFELMMRNAWHISGGEGWCANTSCRRVLVVHNNDTSTVEEIKNDLGIGATDFDKMITKLVEQGVTDIQYIETNDGTKYKPTTTKTTTETVDETKSSTIALDSTDDFKKDPVSMPVAGVPSPVRNPVQGNRRRAAGGESSIVFG